MTRFFELAALLFAQEAIGAIVENGPWTGNDWYDAANKIGVNNGKVYSNENARKRTLKSALSLDGGVDDYMKMRNVQRVARLFTQADWDRGFPLANAVYSREEFLKAVAKFPAFCNETNLPDWSVDDTCKKELATIFAHWG
jgi:hypothetical protein